MKSCRLDFAKGFRVVTGNARAQAAVMSIGPGESEGGRDNRHQGADQWLLVIEGSGIAIVGERTVPLSEATLLLIEAGEAHEIRNTGHGLLKTLNLYAPPAYDAEGDETEAGRSA